MNVLASSQGSSQLFNAVWEEPGDEAINVHSYKYVRYIALERIFSCGPLCAVNTISCQLFNKPLQLT